MISFIESKCVAMPCALLNGNLRFPFRSAQTLQINFRKVDFMVFSFDEEKVKKECYKLVGISNLGAGSLLGYVRRYDKKRKDSGFSLAEREFIYQIADALMVDCESARTLLDSIFKPEKVYSFGYRDSFISSVYHPNWTQKKEYISIYRFYKFCTEEATKLGTNIPFPNHKGMMAILWFWFILKGIEEFQKKVRTESHQLIDAAIFEWLSEIHVIDIKQEIFSYNEMFLFTMGILHNSWYTQEICKRMPAVLSEISSAILDEIQLGSAA